MACPPEYRNWEWGRSVFLCHQDILTVRNQPDSGTAKPNDRIKTLAVNATHTRLATLTSGGRPELWDIGSGEAIIVRHPRRASSIAFSPDGTRLAIGGADGITIVYDAERAVELVSLTGQEEVSSLSFNPDGARLAIGHVDGTAKVWNHLTGDPLFELPVEPGSSANRRVSADGTADLSPDDIEISRQTLIPVTDVTPSFAAFYSQDGRELIIRSQTDLKIFDADHGAELFRLPDDLSGNGMFDVDSTGTHLAALTASGDVQVLEARTGRSLRLIKNSGRSYAQRPTTRLVFSPSGTQLLTTERNGVAWLWDVDDPSGPFVLNRGANYAAFSPDGGRVATIGFENTATIWNTRNGREWLTLRGHRHYIEQIAFCPKGTLIATASRDGVVKLWSVTGAQEMLSGGWVHGAAFSSDGEWMVTAHRDKRLRLWDARTREELFKLEGHAHYVFAVAFSPDKRRLVSGAVDKTAKVWDLTTRPPTLLFTLNGHSGSVNAVGFHPVDGRTIATGSHDQTVKIWDAETGRELHTLGRHFDPVRNVTFSPDGMRLASSSFPKSRFSPNRDPEVRIWDLNARRLLYTLPHEHGALGLAFSPNGKMIATGDEAGTIRLWEAQSGELRTTFQARSAVWELAFMADGKRLVAHTAGMDLPGRNPGIDLWDVETGHEILNLEGASGGTACLAASPNGSSLLMGGTGPRVWEAFPWKETMYPGLPAVPLKERVQNYARTYWREKLSVISLPTPSPLTAFDPTIGYDLVGWPKRSSQSPELLVDLSKHYNGLLTIPWYPVEGWFFFDNDLSALPTGTVTLANVPFDIRGVIQLKRDMQAWRMFPERVEGIAVAQKAQRLHFLQGTVGPEYFDATTEPLEAGTPIGSYVLHYADGSAHELEILYGRDVRDWWLLLDPNQQTARAEAAWIGTNPCTTEVGTSLRLYKRTWDNPKPNVQIESIDFVSKVTKSGPFLIAITLEP